MRPGQNKRMRGRNNNNNNNNSGNRKGPNPLTRSYESNGPDVKIRGNAHHVAEKYLQLARDAQSSGDPVGAESYLQHAEHYFRLIASYQQAQQMGFNRPTEDNDDGDDEDSGIPDRFASPVAPVPFVPQQQPPSQPQPQPQPQPYAGDRQQPAYGDRAQGGERQPYGDRNGGDRNNGYGQRQDRNVQNGPRRPYREDRPYEARNGGDVRNGEFRQNGDRRNGYERMQERAQQQERFNSERGYRDQQPDPSRASAASEQPRIDRPEGEQPPARTEPFYRPEQSAPAVNADSPPQSASRPPVAEDAPGLPSFITTPTRTPAPEAVASSAGEASPTTGFPGDAAAEAPKFPRRRRRTVRAAPVDGDEAPAEQSAGD